MNNRTVQEPSKQTKLRRPRYSKTDPRYWHSAIFQPTYTRNGITRNVRHWSAKIQHAGRRETVPLGTPNRAAAAAIARDFYLALRSSGWDAGLARYKAKGRARTSIATVGDFLDEVQAHWSGRQKTVRDYARAFRTIITDVFEIGLGSNEKFDYRRGGRDRWLQKVHRVRLAEITPDKIQKWKVAFVRRAGSDPVRQRAAKISANSLMRQAKSLFAPAVLKFVPLSVSVNPFDGVSFEPRQSMRYRSTFNIETLVQAAMTQLPQEELKVFLLAAMAGLRRNEIDKLEWTAFRWDRGMIRIEATTHFHPKSEDSIGDIEVDSELMSLFRGLRTPAPAQSRFVVGSTIEPRPAATYSHYRCERTFHALGNWLREQGVTGATPLHTLRKEYGSQICAKHGIYAASNALRHADIAITSQHYLDRPKRATLGLGKLLSARNTPS